MKCLLEIIDVKEATEQYNCTDMMRGVFTAYTVSCFNENSSCFFSMILMKTECRPLGYLILIKCGILILLNMTSRQNYVLT